MTANGHPFRLGVASPHRERHVRLQGITLALRARSGPPRPAGESVLDAPLLATFSRAVTWTRSGPTRRGNATRRSCLRDSSLQRGDCAGGGNDALGSPSAGEIGGPSAETRASRRTDSACSGRCHDRRLRAHAHRRGRVIDALTEAGAVRPGGMSATSSGTPVAAAR